MLKILTGDVEVPIQRVKRKLATVSWKQRYIQNKDKLQIIQYYEKLTLLKLKEIFSHFLHDCIKTL